MEQTVSLDEKDVQINMREQYNSIYYWKTIYDLNSAELAFLKEHNVKRIYIRYFDVALENTYPGGGIPRVMPIATTIFRQTPDKTMEVIPTVYITYEAMRNMKGVEAEYANNIITRILAMTKGNNIPNVKEVQFDCDWTKTTQASYFELCRIAKDSLHNRGMILSSTIRLHQLSDLIPPVDRGVLMLYNTGALKEPLTKNSILNYSDIEPYLKSAEYDLPLDFAYPTFAWGVWFCNGTFKAIIRRTDFSDQTLYQDQRNGTYKVVKDHYLESHELCKGDIIRLENSNHDEIVKVKHLVESKLRQDKYSVILYHLDSTNLSKYTTNEIKGIY